VVLGEGEHPLVEVEPGQLPVAVAQSPRFVGIDGLVLLDGRETIRRRNHALTLPTGSEPDMDESWLGRDRPVNFETVANGR
jgi:hypothetical protein